MLIEINSSKLWSTSYVVKCIAYWRKDMQWKKGCRWYERQTITSTMYINETWVLQDNINTNFTAVNARFICYTYLVLILNNCYYFSESYLIYLWSLTVNCKSTISNMFTDNHFYLALHSIQHFIYFQERKEHYFIFKLKKW